MAIKLDISSEGLGASVSTLRSLGDNSIRAQADAINRTLAGMRTDATRMIVKQSGIKRSVVFSAFTLIKGHVSGGDITGAAVKIKGGPMPVFAMGARPRKVMGGKTRGGVTFKGADGAKVRLKHAFVSRMGSGHMGVFQRDASGTRFMRGKDEEKTPTKRPMIDEVYGPSVPQIAQRKMIYDAMIKEAAARCQKRVEHLLKQYLEKKGR